MFAQVLHQLRVEARLTQEEVAARARVSRQYISMLEAGKNLPTIDVFIRICHAIGASPADVITRLDKRRV